jgi:integrase
MDESQEKVGRTGRARRGRGEGGIHRRKSDGLYEGTVSLGFDHDTGKRRKRTVYGRTKKEVLDKMRDILNRTANGTLTDPTKLTVGEYLHQWLETTAKSNVRVGTWTLYEQLVRLRIRPFLGGVRLTSLTAFDVGRWLSDLQKAGVSDRGRQMAGTLLHTALAYAVHPLRLIPHNPAGDVDKPRPPKPEVVVLDPDQVALFLQEAANDRLYALYVLAIDSGMREGELFGLEWSDIDFPSRSIQVKRSLKEVGGKVWTEDLKTAKSRRRIVVSPRTLDALHEHRKRQLVEGNARNLVFCSPEGEYLRRPNVARRSFFPILRRAGLPRIKFHALRHTSATLLMLAEEPAKVVSERLGHGTTQTTLEIYSHVLPTMKERAAEKMDRIMGQAMPRKVEPGLSVVSP